MSAQPEDFRAATSNAMPNRNPSLGTNVQQATGRTQPNGSTPAGSVGPTASITGADTRVDSAPWGLLSLLAENLDDLERTRIAAENRARALAQVYDLEGEPPHTQAVALAEAIGAIEHGAELQLKRALRKHPLDEWIKTTVGVGEKQGARLLAAIGDPYWNTLRDRPRTVSELWAYCGYHVLPARQPTPDDQCRSASGDKHGDTDQSSLAAHARLVGVAASRRKGERANWSNTAKMRAHLIAESCIKQAHSPYRGVYDAGRAKYIDAAHATECARCGPKGKPAPLGSALSDGHKHARSLRLVAKTILRDLWHASKQLHEQQDGVTA